jgi:hypothetical protein
MEYKGILYAKLAGKYISMDKTGSDWDALEERNKELTRSIDRMHYDNSVLTSEKVKLLEEIEAQANYIEFLGRHYNMAYSVASAHYYKELQEDIDKGESLRNIIKELKTSKF